MAETRKSSHHYIFSHLFAVIAIRFITFIALITLFTAITITVNVTISIFAIIIIVEITTSVIINTAVIVTILARLGDKVAFLVVSCLNQMSFNIHWDLRYDALQNSTFFFTCLIICFTNLLEHQLLAHELQD